MGKKKNYVWILVIVVLAIFLFSGPSSQLDTGKYIQSFAPTYEGGFSVPSSTINPTPLEPSGLSREGFISFEQCLNLKWSDVRYRFRVDYPSGIKSDGTVANNYGSYCYVNEFLALLACTAPNGDDCQIIFNDLYRKESDIDRLSLLTACAGGNCLDPTYMAQYGNWYLNAISGKYVGYNCIAASACNVVSEYTCDKPGGNDYYQKGTGTIYKNSVYILSAEDSCTGDTLYEVSCTNEQTTKGAITVERKECGEGCSDGACLTSRGITNNCGGKPLWSRMCSDQNLLICNDNGNSYDWEIGWTCPLDKQCDSTSIISPDAICVSRVTPDVTNVTPGIIDGSVCCSGLGPPSCKQRDECKPLFGFIGGRILTSNDNESSYCPTQCVPDGGAVTPPPNGGAVTPPPNGGAVTPPPNGGAVTPPLNGGAVTSSDLVCCSGLGPHSCKQRDECKPLFGFIGGRILTSNDNESSYCPTQCVPDGGAVTPPPDGGISGGEGQSLSLRYSEWKDASAGQRIKTLCIDDSNCAPYEDLEGSGEQFKVACIGSQKITSQLELDAENICEKSGHAGESWKGAVIGGAVGCAGGLALTVGLAATGIGLPIALFTGAGTVLTCIVGGTVGAAVVTGVQNVVQLNCETGTYDGIKGACIAQSSGGSICEALQWAPSFFGISKCIMGVIIIAGGILLLFLLMRPKRPQYFPTSRGVI